MLNAKSIRDSIIDDITYGMLSVGASMEECFEHIFCCCDYEAKNFTAYTTGTDKNYTITFADGEEEFSILAEFLDGVDCIGYSVSIAPCFCDDEWSSFSDYCQLTETLAKWIKAYCLGNL